MSLSLDQLAHRIGAEVIGDASATVSGCAPIDTAGPGEIAFLANERYARYLGNTSAAAVIVGRRVQSIEGATLLVADDPYFAFRQAMIELHGFRPHPQPLDAANEVAGPDPDPAFDGTPKRLISPRAAIHPEAKIGEGTIIHPFATVERDAVLGRGCVLYPGVYIGPDARVGDGCTLYPGVVIYDRCIIGSRVTLHANTVIGQDGFGYATHQGAHHKIPQHGIVVIEDDVELGASCAIERAAMGETRIGKGSKFADLISIGHGTTIGQHCLFVSLVGVSGSVKIGNYVVLGGQVGVSGHLTVGDFVQAAGKTAIISDVPDGMKIGGIPGIEFNKAKRNALIASDLIGLVKRIKQLEARVKELEGGTQQTALAAQKSDIADPPNG